MGDELLTALDHEGKILAEGVLRSEAHRRGVWHRSIGVIVLNANGEVLLEKRSLHKDVFPGFYDIPGGHVKFGAGALRTALEEIREELSLALPPNRLAPLCDEDGLKERIVLPEHSI